MVGISKELGRRNHNQNTRYERKRVKTLCDSSVTFLSSFFSDRIVFLSVELVDDIIDDLMSQCQLLGTTRHI